MEPGYVIRLFLFLNPKPMLLFNELHGKISLSLNGEINIPTSGSKRLATPMLASVMFHSLGLLGKGAFIQDSSGAKGEKSVLGSHMEELSQNRKVHLCLHEVV